MKKDPVKVVEEVLTLNQQMNDLTMDAINDMAPEAKYQEPEVQLSRKELAAQEGYFWIEPKRTLPAVGILPESQKKDHAHDWEYVRGIYENFVVAGEGVEFWLCKYAGDKDCLWLIPANKPVYIPRMVAKHLEEVQKYHKFKYHVDNVSMGQASSGDHGFSPFETHYRGKFRAIGAFS